MQNINKHTNLDLTLNKYESGYQIKLLNKSLRGLSHYDISLLYFIPIKYIRKYESQIDSYYLDKQKHYLIHIKPIGLDVIIPKTYLCPSCDIYHISNKESRFFHLIEGLLNDNQAKGYLDYDLIPNPILKTSKTLHTKVKS